MMSMVDSWFPSGITGRWILGGLSRNPFTFLIAFARSLLVTYKITGKFIPIKIRIGIGIGQKLDVFRSKNTEVVIDGVIQVTPWGGSRLNSSIYMDEGSQLKILGNFEIGPNVHIVIGKGARLKITGQRTSTASGITCNTRIMVENSIDIGADCIIAWDVFISDSNWHDIKGAMRCEPISTGVS